jgi:protocatechuate 3,4-dioxygenase beta subunit
LELGLENVGEVARDPALGPIRTHADFKKWVGEHSDAASICLAPDFEVGRRICIDAEICHADGRPVRNAKVLLYQTGADGLYSHVGGGDDAARLFGYARTDEKGCFEAQTIFPGGYPRTLIPAHLHVTIWEEGEQGRGHRLEFVFDDDPRMSDSARESARSWGWPIVQLDQDGRGRAKVTLPR